MVFVSENRAAWSDRKSVPQAEQKRESSAFSLPHFGHIIALLFYPFMRITIICSYFKSVT